MTLWSSPNQSYVSLWNICPKFIRFSPLVLGDAIADLYCAHQTIGLVKMWQHWTDAVGVLRSWIAELNGNAKTATIAAAVATGTGLAAAVYIVWTTDRSEQIAEGMNALGVEYDELMTDHKRKLFGELQSLKDARGDGRLVLLEIGCAGGHNFKYYPAGSELICVEPNPRHKATLYRGVGEHPGLQISAYHVSSAENLRDVQSAGSVDAVISTLVLCTVSDPEQCVQEIIRVLKPGGKWYFMEHVRAPPRFYVVRFMQKVFNFAWSLYYDGCHVARSPQHHIRKAGFSRVDIKDFEAHELMQTRLAYGVRLVRSHISGTATK